METFVGLILWVVFFAVVGLFCFLALPQILIGVIPVVVLFVYGLCVFAIGHIATNAYELTFTDNGYKEFCHPACAWEPSFLIKQPDAYDTGPKDLSGAGVAILDCTKGGQIAVATEEQMAACTSERSIRTIAKVIIERRLEECTNNAIHISDIEPRNIAVRGCYSSAYRFTEQLKSLPHPTQEFVRTINF